MLSCACKVHIELIDKICILELMWCAGEAEDPVPGAGPETHDARSGRQLDSCAMPSIFHAIPVGLAEKATFKVLRAPPIFSE